VPELGPPWQRPLAGRIDEHVLDSQALTGNPLGDPHERPLLVWTPPDYSTDPDRSYPVIYRLQGFTNQLDTWRNRRPFQPNALEAADAALADPAIPPVILVHVDAWTSLGGSQFLDSPGTGRYHTYLCDEVVSWIDGHYRTLAAPAHRAVAGHSSGGYGAMVTPMLRPDRFGAFATHAGDALFEHCFLPDFRVAARALRDRYGGGLEAFVAAVRDDPAAVLRRDGALLNAYAMAACFSADANGSVHLPFDVETGQLVLETWARWLDRDPVRMVPSHAEALRSMRAIWIDAGRSDDYYLDLGAMAFRRALTEAGVDETRIHFELFEGTHSGNERSYLPALRWLAERIAPA
jgi:S-formylglutathione hydrolase FrmB